MITEIIKNCIVQSTDPDDAVKRIQESIGGMLVYVPSYRSHHIKTRNCLIREFYTGSNAKETCKEFAISETTLRRITKGWCVEKN